ncbi:lipase-like, partial [Phalaenopsis equestris]|uniref:lipase-like n=1 Tax=Phalaenopsis equestris TaxID=78828 RepID=UPI0009E65D8A
LNLCSLLFILFLPEFLKVKGTQAFICCDKADDANVIVLAFRGTEAFNAFDWITDVDLSWLSMGKYGKAHLGFMRALGLQDEKDIEKGFPREHPELDEGRFIAYYAIRETLRELLEKHKRARIIITGHSLGGALAILFPAILAMHEQQDIIDRIHGVMTYGQPRVGDAEFGRNVSAVLKSKYHRMVYRYDIVPRVPFDKPPVALFKHFGTCIYFTSWYEGKVSLLLLLLFGAV